MTVAVPSKKLSNTRAASSGSAASRHRLPHQLHPTITSVLVNDKRPMPHTQPRVPTALDILHRAAKSEHQELPQPFFRARQIPRRIHRSQNVITGNLPVERRYQPRKAIFPNCLVNVRFFHAFMLLRTLQVVRHVWGIGHGRTGSHQFPALIP